jgi:flagellar hook-basal body complex protein FliE
MGRFRASGLGTQNTKRGPQEPGPHCFRENKMDAVRGISYVNAQPQAPKRGNKGEGTFLDTLNKLVGQTNADLKEADHKREQFAVGNQYDVHEIMITAEKADLSFRLLLQIRNKLLEAYQEIMRMQF